MRLLGLDFGSTTSSAMMASARICVSSATGRMEFGSPMELYRSEPVFTPYDHDDLDIERLEGLLDGWLVESGLSLDDVFAGAAITTGLAAQGQCRGVDGACRAQDRRGGS
jgi:ethanolamine utilization protein EutA